MTDDEHELLTQASELNHKLEEVPIAKVLQQYNRQRTLLLGLLGLTVALLLTVGVLVGVAIRASQNSRDIDRLCRTRPLFDFMVVASARNPNTDQALVLEFQKVIDQAYAGCPTSNVNT